MASAKMTPVLYEHRYGLRLPARLDDLTLELLAMQLGHRPEDGGLGRYGHFRVVCQMLFPWLEWNPWLEWECQRLLEFPGAGQARVRRHAVALTGCGAAGKTFGVTLVAVVWWLCDPANSSVVLTSTEKSVIRRRMWPVVDKLYKGMVQPGTTKPMMFGHFVDSMTKWNATKGDDLHGVTAVAVAKGDTQKAVDYLKGVHARRMFLMIDEATATPEAIMLTISNMMKGCDELVVVIIGNAVSRLDPHGRACEPLAGWESVGVEDEEWRTKGVPEWELPPGVCLHFDGKKSPNVTMGLLDGKNRWPMLYTLDNWERAQANAELKGLNFWSQDRGFWCPDGATHTVFSEQAVLKYGGLRRDVTWLRQTTRVAFLDTAFGGDDCVFLEGEFGEVAEGEGEVLMLGEPEVVPVRADNPNEIEYQIAMWVMARCVRLGVRPEGFGMDSTGTGKGAASVMAREWSLRIHRVEWGGGASERAAAPDDARPAREVYVNQSTELHWRARELLFARRLRGLHRQAVKELCARSYEVLNKRYRVIPKPEFKVLFGKSPDYGDVTVGLVEVARLNGMKGGGKLAVMERVAWRKAARRVAEADEGGGGGEQAFAEGDIYDKGEVRQLW